MKLNLEYNLHEIVPNYEQEPVWAPQIKRWSQLDQESYAVAEATHRSLKFLGNPDQLIILSSQGSSHTDFLFAHSKKISPSYFVHTLPNVRSLVFSGLTGWEGPVFCFSQGKHSLVRFLDETTRVHSQLKTLVLNLNRVDGVYHCDFYKIGSPTGEVVLEWEHEGQPLMNDFEFREELKHKNMIQVHEGMRVRKI